MCGYISRGTNIFAVAEIFFLTNFFAGSNGEPARMLKCKKVEKLFPIDQMVVKRLCNNVVEKIKKSFSAGTNAVPATMLK